MPTVGKYSVQARLDGAGSKPGLVEGSLPMAEGLELNDLQVPSNPKHSTEFDGIALKMPFCGGLDLLCI